MAFRLLLDAEFPDPTRAHSRPGIVLERWQREDLSDSQLVEVADKEGYNAVAFVGPHVIARREVIDAAFRTGLSLVVTAASDPIRAQRDLASHLAAVVKVAGPGRLIWVTAHRATTIKVTQRQTHKP